MRISPIPVLLVVILVGGLSVAAPTPCSAQESLPWTKDTIFPLSVMPTTEGGACARIAINPENQRPVVAFVRSDSEPGAGLSLMRDYGEGPDDGWFYLGFPDSISMSDLDMDFWISASTWKIGVSYRDNSDDSLRFLETVYDRLSGTQTSTSIMIQDADSFDYGVGTSVKYDSSGNPHIAAYVSSLFASDSLLYATYVGSGGNCGYEPQLNKWSCQTIDSGTDVGRDPSLTLDGAEQPVIAYTKLYGDVELVFVTRPTSSGAGSCGGGYWNCGYIDSETLLNDQSKAAVHWDQSAAQTGIHVAFHTTSHYSSTPISILHGVWVGGGQGNCGLPADWDCDWAGENADGGALELGTNHSGKPVLAFPTQGLMELAFNEYLGDAWAGNCGTTDKWQCDVIEPDLGLADEMGQWLDLAVGDDGQPQVVYTKFLHDTFEFELKLAYPWTFRDSFESGDLVVWSA